MDARITARFDPFELLDEFERVGFEPSQARMLVSKIERVHQLKRAELVTVASFDTQLAGTEARLSEAINAGFAKIDTSLRTMVASVAVFGAAAIVGATVIGYLVR